MHQINMLKPLRISIIILTIILSCIWIILTRIQDTFMRSYQTFVINVPKIRNNPNTFNAFMILDEIKNKKKIHIELNEDRIANQKKIDLIIYEARKLKYTKDTSTVIDINFTTVTTFREIMQLIEICYTDNHKRFALLNKRLIIYGEYPLRKMDTTRNIPLIYL